MNDFNKGVNYAFDYILRNLKACNIGDGIEGCITRSELQELKKTISFKCNFCEYPCENDWCSTKDNK
jgi:hypothetical protein